MRATSATTAAGAALAGLALLGPAAFPPAAWAAPERYAVQDAWPGAAFDVPVHVAAPRDGSDRLFVVERPGRILVGKKFRGGQAVARPTLFLDVRHLQMPPDKISEGHGGLLSLAFPPDYARSGTFAVFYGTGSGTPQDPFRSVVATYRRSDADPDVADPASGRIVLSVPKKGPIHFGGGLCYGPDGTLYVGIADNGEKDDPSKLGQDTRQHLAKVLRIDPRPGPAGQPYTVPPDNPWADGRGGVRPEIFAYGVRNPFRLSFDATTGTLWLGDPGQRKREEVDVVPRAGNLGWPMMEGDQVLTAGANPADYTAPVFAYGRDMGGCVIGGRVYRGQRCPALVGKYLFGDNAAAWPSDDTKAGRVWALAFKDQRAVGAPEHVVDVADLVSVDEDADGEIYFACLETKRVMTLVPAE